MPPAALERAMHGFMLSEILFTGDQIGILDLLSRRAPATADQVADALALERDATHRWLRAATAVGLLQRAEDRFSVSDEIGPYVTKDDPRYLGGWFAHLRDVTSHSFRGLTDALRSGAPRDTTSDEDRALFERLYADGRRRSAFADAMWALGYEAAQVLVNTPHLSQVRELVDVGGGSGSFAVAAAQRHPQLRATVVDLPSVRPDFERMVRRFGLEQRVSFVAADFFRDPLPEGDAYALGYILSDWSTDDGTRLLCKLHDHLPENGLVLVLERFFDTEDVGPVSTALMDLSMLLETHGRHRSQDAYKVWLESIGFVDCEVVMSPAHKHMLTARRAAAPRT